ncbi:MAG: histidine phosphatase family protein [Burkholderiales bacterium]|jgi:probable phosphoglycerate mutase|nr:Glucosyl-3-phosphoglycerate phosphatase [Betaproteobacteria bacterium MOLA814]|tara:strand:- start:7264 stop:7878 length:615 start_codon:yes stop_codon:yes gene_type:complete
MQATRIIAIRHGETDWNAATRIQGHTDIALNANGVEQARQLGAALANEEIDAVYASDLSRAADTAQAIATHHKLTVHTHTGLRERHFGYFEGLTWAAIEAKHPKDALAWRSRDTHFAPAGGESLVALKARVVNTLNELAAKHLGQHIVIAAHGGILDQLYRLANNLDLQTKRDWHLGNAAVNRLLWTPESLSLVIWGDTGHLHT